MAGKSRLDPFDLSHKVEGFYATPVPLIDSDPDTGLGLGTRVYFYWDGPRKDPLYEYTPYRHALYAQTFATTAGYQYQTITYDAPYLLGSPLRVRAELDYEKNIAANYFGRGAATLGPLGFPGSSERFTSFSAYTSALDQVRPGRLDPSGSVYALYDKYLYEDPALRGSIERDLAGGLVRVQAGFTGTYARIGDYSGQEVAATLGQASVQATEAPTRLRADCASGVVVGCAGGWNSTLKLGVAFDTRDYEPDPNSGVFADVTAELSSRYLGSDYDYVRVTASPRVFYSPVPRWTDLVLAGRLVYSVQTSGTPFFAMNTLAFTDTDRQGLGGVSTLRGYNQDRFVGAIASLANLEARWTFAHADLLEQRFGVALVAFLDTGRVFDRVGDFTFADWKRGEGGGVRVAWNKATIVRADLGMSDEGWAYYMDFGQQF